MQSSLDSSSGAVAAAGAQVSQLWGHAGELWSPRSRLPDFSYAGYHCGEAPLPVLPPGVSVKAFGAKGDGVADDTQAFLDAIARAPAGAIEIPAGRYKITQIIEITRPGIVLRGEGPDRTVLYCPVPLNDIRPDWGATTGGERTSNYSWSGGIIWIKGDYRNAPLTPILGEAARGDTSVRVQNTAALHEGQRVQIYQADLPDNSLAEHLYSGDPGNTAKLLGRSWASLVCRITRIEGDRVHFDRPLRCDFRPQWKPEIRAFDPTVTEVGVESLCFEFPTTPYLGHFKEVGYNALSHNGCADCWVRDIRIVDADSGLFPSAMFCTFQGIVFESSRPVDVSGSTGHHGLNFAGADDLFIDFDFRTQFIHDISVDGVATGNVSANGKGVDLCLDHHKRTCSENLFSNLDAGAGTHLWRCGGGGDLGKHCAARGTFWNIRARVPQTAPGPDFGPASMNFIALHTTDPTDINPEGRWFEAIPSAEITPQELHAAQLDRRLKAGR